MVYKNLPEEVLTKLNTQTNLKKIRILFAKGHINQEQISKIFTILENHKTIKKIDLTVCNIKDNGEIINKLCKMLKNNQIIKSLILDYKPININECNILANMLRTNNTITQFSFIILYTHRIPQGEKILCDALKQNTTITHLQLTIYLTNNENLQDINTLVYQTKTLKYLTINLYGRNTNMINNLYNSLKNNTSIIKCTIKLNWRIQEYDWKYVSDIIKNNRTIRYLNIKSGRRDPQINTVNSHFIFEALKHNNTLEHFMVDKFIVNQNTLKSTIDMFKHNNTLKKIMLNINEDIDIRDINLIPCDITLRVNLNIYDRLFDVLKNNKNIKKIYFESFMSTNINKLIDALKFNSTLKIVQFHRVIALTDSVMKQFVETKYNRGLKIIIPIRTHYNIDIEKYKKNDNVVKFINYINRSQIEKNIQYINKSKNKLKSLSNKIIKNIYRDVKYLPPYINKDIKHNIEKYRIKRDILTKY